MKKVIITKVLSNEEIASGIHKISIERKKGFGEILPGQFLHIKCGQEEGVLLRRPISVSYADEREISLIIRKAGRGTTLLCNSNIGQDWDILGPLGNGFTINEKYKKVMVVGGGIGVAPLLELTKGLKEKNTDVLLGYKEEPFLVEEFEKYASVSVTTENGSQGHKGFINELVVKQLKEQKPDMLYACGPEAMLKEIQTLCKEYNVESQISLEERMACGVGACLVCACKLKKDKTGHIYAKTCKDGPVFLGEEVIFGE